MLLAENTARLDDDTSRARENSLLLWATVAGAGGAPANEFPSANEEPQSRRLRLVGRYRVGDGNEFPCEIPELSPLGIKVKGPKDGRVGKWCTAYIASVGIIEGVVVEARQHAFVVGIIAPQRRLRRLGQRLRWQLMRGKADFKERRSSERIEMNGVKAELETLDGQIRTCEVFDLSDGGAALHLGGDALYFWVDQPVRFEGRFARVLRVFPGGMVIKFD